MSEFEKRITDRNSILNILIDVKNKKISITDAAERILKCFPEPESEQISEEGISHDKVYMIIRELTEDDNERLYFYKKLLKAGLISQPKKTALDKARERKETAYNYIKELESINKEMLEELKVSYKEMDIIDYLCKIASVYPYTLRRKALKNIIEKATGKPIEEAINE
jgi:SET domain-containing protein